MEIKDKTEVPVFQDGLVIESTDNYDVVYGYKKGAEGKKEGERTFLVPKSRKAEKVLVASSEINKNVLSERPHGDKETIKAIRFNGPTKELLDFLHSDKGQEYGVFGTGVPSLDQLDSEVTQE